MKDFFSFIRFYVDAAKDFPKNRKAISFALIATALGNIPTVLTHENVLLETASSSPEDLLRIAPTILLIFLFSTVTSTFFSESLLLSLWKPKRKTVKLLRAASGYFPKFIALKIGFLAFSIILLYILSLPAILAIEKSEELSRTLLLSGLLVSIPVLAMAFLTETYASFHLLFSSTGILESIRIGYALFKRKLIQSITFIGLSFSFTVLASAIFSGIRYLFSLFIPNSVTNETSLLLIMILLQSAFLVLEKSAWIRFFSFINTEAGASMDQEASQNEEKMIQKEVSEIG
jgi:hypothetical protein